ncbi:MAG: hypothetical protein OXG35_14805 [Acidobacteria bacterium]|nr:hypothetical protein [Acidobacteriota bacterium]
MEGRKVALTGSLGPVHVVLYPFVCVYCEEHFWSGYYHERACTGCRRRRKEG